MKKRFISVCATFLFPAWILAQSVGIQTNTPHPNASLDIRGVNKGLLIPRGDNASRVALNANTAKGLMMYDTLVNSIWVHNGNGLASGWQSLSTGVNYWSLNGALGTEICNNNTGGFWSANPTPVLEVPDPILPPVSGAGTRLMWMPERSAFRVGTVDSDQWDASNIGVWSFATGFNSKAIGGGSIAMGLETIATNSGSIALGSGAAASQISAVSIGESTMASGFRSVAIGHDSKALGEGSVAIGKGCISSGSFSSALGYFTKSIGLFSTAVGYGNSSRGSYSTALCHSNTAKGYASMVIGMFSDSILHISQTTPADSTPLFIIGNGNSNIDRSNVLVVYKNGITEVNGPADISGNTAIDGFTNLGNTAPKIKMKKLTGVSAATQNAWTNVTHGLTQAKIISVNIIMTIPDFVNLPPSYTFHPGYQYEYQVTATHIVVINTATNSANILSKAFTVLIVYEE